MSFKVREPFIHVLFWVAGFGLIYLAQLMRFGPIEYGSGGMFLLFLVGTLINMSVFYLAVFRWVPTWKRLGWKNRATLELVGAALVSTLIKSSVLITAYHYFGYEEPPNDLYTILPYFHLFMTGIFTIFGSTYRLTKDQVEGERIRRQLEHQQVTSELAYLKMQVNPHFLFNTLNNLFGMATREGADRTGEGILKLADLMRYLLHEVGEENVSLERELDCLRSYIDLQRLRISEKHDVRIQLDIEGSTLGVTVPPMMLIPMVENAFKYGISFKNRSEILMRLEVTSGEISFKVENTINRKDEELEGESGGIGLGNQRRRLTLLYGDTDCLSCEEYDGRYHAHLRLPRSRSEHEPAPVKQGLTREVTA